MTIIHKKIHQGQSTRCNAKGFFVVLLICCLAAMPAAAQNRIDELVDNFSTTGSAKFTSVIDRDPKTRRVQKVVKVLEMHSVQAAKFREAFNAEAARLRNAPKGESELVSYSHRQDGDEQTTTLSCENKTEVRIYMLRLTGRQMPSTAKATIIVKKK